nr:unnamed protein product [uncultured bacterium]
MKIEKLDDFVPSKNMITKITKMNNVIEFISMQKKNNSCPIRKINKNQYVHISTGEIFDCNHIKNRSENLYGIKISTHELRDLINFNFSGGKNELWITLTFGKNKVYNPKELYPIFTNFIKRFRYHFSGLVIDYIYIPEPHEKGDWHIHLLLKANKELYIKNSELNKIWGYGFVKVNRLKDVDNIGAYVSAYLTNIKEGEETKKGARLHLYPPGHQLYRYSKGIKKPSSVYGSYSDAKKEVGSHKPTYKTTFKISSDDGFSNIIHKEYYNLKR